MSTTTRSLLLHAGTPKTGTKSLQSALHTSGSRLLANGVLYPDVELSPDLKHQWIVNCLLADDLEHFRRNVREVVEAAESVKAKRVVLSTEGIFLHWSDYSTAARLALGELASSFDVTVWTVFRDPLSFSMSLYAQVLKNAPSHLTTCYGTTATPEDIADHPWFIKRMDYAGFIGGIERLFGPGCVVATRYIAGKTVEQARTILGVDEAILPDVPARNLSLSRLGVDLMRRLNGLALEAPHREKLVATIIVMDQLLARADERLVPSDDMARKIAHLSRESSRYLADRYGIVWPDNTRPGDAA